MPVRPEGMTQESKMSLSCGVIDRMLKMLESTTVTLNAQVLVFPAESMTTQFTGVVPIANWLPETGEQLATRLESQLSETVTENTTTALLESWALTRMLDGQATSGG